jgi:hypothetical protein
MKKIEKNHFKNFISGRLTDICQNPGELADEILSFTKGHPYYIEKWRKLNEARKNLSAFRWEMTGSAHRSRFLILPDRNSRSAIHWLSTLFRILCRMWSMRGSANANNRSE